MKTWICIAAFTVASACAVTAAAAQEDGPHDLRGNPAALQAMSAAASIAYAILADKPAPAGLLPEEGCIVWQAPGVALVPDATWLPETSIKEELMLGDERTGGLLADAYNFIWGEPEQPSEDDYAAGREMPRQVYLLDTATACGRLDRYYDHYCEWMELNADQPGLGEDELYADFAVVYGEPGGLLEMYFAYSPVGGLQLVQLVIVDYFSA